MVKIHDQTAAFSAVVPSRRRSRAAAGERFRLGLHGLDCGPSGGPEVRSAVIGASAWALKAEQVERTVELIGMAGGLLADLGFQACPIGADRQERPSLVIWVCGDETRADEYEQLSDMEVPGLSIGSCVEDLDDGGFITTEEAEDRREFTRLFASLVESLVGSDRSNIWSNELRQTESDDLGPRTVDKAADLHQRGRAALATAAAFGWEYHRATTLIALSQSPCAERARSTPAHARAWTRPMPSAPREVFVAGQPRSKRCAADISPAEARAVQPTR